MHSALYVRISELEKNATQVILTALILAKKNPLELLLACRDVFANTYKLCKHTCTCTHTGTISVHTFSMCLNVLCPHITMTTSSA